MYVWIAELSPPYRLEGVLPVNKVQRSEQSPSLLLLVTLRPALSDQIPLWLELPAQNTSKSRLQRRKEDCDGVIPRRFCQFRVGRIVELESAGERFCMEVIESVAG